MLLAALLAVNIPSISANAIWESKNQVTTYAESILPQYLSVNGLFSHEYKISEPITLYNWEYGQNDKILFFVFDNNQAVGQLVVQNYEGKLYSSFNTGNLDIITEAFNNNTPVAFGYYNECFVMRTESENILLSVTTKDNPLDGLSDNVRLKTSTLNYLTPISIDNLSQINSAIAPHTTVYDKQLGVNLVSNDSVNGVGICWASCVASKVNYQKRKSLYAIDVYNKVDSLYSGTPIGNTTWITRAYSAYDVNITTENNSVGASKCYSQLSSGKPLHITITRNGGAHGVLIAGVYYLDVSSAGGVYTLMDPNVPSLVSLAVQPSVIQNGSGFNYVTSYGYTYTNWDITRY